ncbi:MAG: SAM-dependent methyltransferase [Bacteroidales bacterium]|nr:SAM-dependent methyltransferase [Bacteroidales bacterium]
MRVFEAHISDVVMSFLDGLAISARDYTQANQSIEEICGCKDFFPSEDWFVSLKDELNKSERFCLSEDRGEYGDFQTNMYLTKAVAKVLLKKKITPEIVIEPTCGKGNFILAALQSFPSIKQIIGIEIYEPYVWECKFNILDYYLTNPEANKPLVQIYHFNVFDFDFLELKRHIQKANFLVIGNPPWVTNSMLGVLESDNLPPKANFKKNKGLDAITGKGNFDIAEYIVMSLMRTFEKCNGCLALLVKNSVIKNIVYEQRNNRFCISDFEEMHIDSKKEFNVFVESSLLFCRFGQQPSQQCEVSDFYTGCVINKFGWSGNSFYSNLETDRQVEKIEGKCPLEWRQGIKHDCSKVMELERNGNVFCNKLGEVVDLEENLVYGLLKSSDLKSTITSKPKRFTIVPQQFIGQNTDYISKYPKTYSYLQKHLDLFRNRKSTIYKGKPDFSIFGIGDYSFKPYKVAISGLYKTFHFTLVLPDQKPVMLDDTCYFLGFDDLKSAVAVQALLNSDMVKSFLQTTTFADAKRMITKDVLMRIDLRKVLMFSDMEKLVKQANVNLGALEKKKNIDNDDFTFALNQKDMQLELF